MNCATVDELAAAYGLGATDGDEERAISVHLASCDRPHEEARELIGAAGLIAAGEAPVQPSPALRDRLMASIDRTPQDHVAERPTRGIESIAQRRPWWRSPLPAGLAAAGLVVALGLGSVNLALSQELAERDTVLRAVAGADAIYAVTGSAGSGWVVQAGDRAMFMAQELAELPQDRIYELWLIDGDTPVAVGTVEAVRDLTLVTLERSLEGATAFAVTIEEQRVDAPTSDPVLVAPLDG